MNPNTPNTDTSQQGTSMEAYGWRMGKEVKIDKPVYIIALNLKVNKYHEKVSLNVFLFYLHTLLV